MLLSSYFDLILIAALENNLFVISKKSKKNNFLFLREMGGIQLNFMISFS